MTKRVIAVIGPTAIGKSALGLALAKRYNGEIISGDSIQVYRRLDIGSAKATRQEREEIPHHLIDILEPDAAYSVADFQRQGRQLITELHRSGKLPVIVGGTGFYIKALLYDYLFPPEETTASERLLVTNQQLKEQLTALDPATSAKIHVNNRKRLIRALDMAEQGHKRSTVLAEQHHEPLYDALVIGLTTERTRLYQRIDERVDAMFAAGLPDEVKDLYTTYPGLFSFQAMQGIGYREWRDYYAGHSDMESVRKQIKIHSHQFAKRQYTWFRNQMAVNWYDIEAENYPEVLYADCDRWYRHG